MTSNTRIAIVGIGLRYPDASSPGELWDNVLAGRRAFRRLPDERMNHADYFSADPAAPDRFYSSKAAVLRDFEFDRVKYKVAGSTFRSTDLTHWLALDVAAQALADAGFPGGAGLPKQSTGVVIGNSLTGEFSRANLMRLRWPYVRRTVAAALAEKGWDDGSVAEFLQSLEPKYKAPFPPIDEDSLAGGLANTIAGRICNYFDLAGGGYTVDGACSSSLLSVVTAARSLIEGDLDVALAGGVDLSIDPFEVIGFAKTGALATGEMKVYDRDSNGFWPGEGSGAVVLMREKDALARGKKIYASITGWGVSSDGKGGITRPEASGHRLAVSRAYDRAGYGVGSVSYFEGHGTGTALGDATEITALSSARRDADPLSPKAALSSVKGNFGHTKAAAGVAGLIKAALSVHNQVIPPGTGQRDPHPLLLEDEATMYFPTDAGLWPRDQRIRAGVSAMGFGGINTHIAIEQAPGVQRRTRLSQRATNLVGGRQDAEVLLLDADDADGLRDKVAGLEELIAKLSYAELSDLAFTLAGSLSGRPMRAALVATGPEEATRKLAKLGKLIGSGETEIFDAADGIFAVRSTIAPKITFLFPGQGSGRGAIGAIRRRFPIAEGVFREADVPADGDQVATEVAQPRIVAGSVAALRVLDSLGIVASAAVGHSLGELTALSWGGAMDAAKLLKLAAIRGKVMAGASRGGGTMAGLGTGPEKALQLANGLGVVIAGYNGPDQTVISGAVESVELVCKKAVSEGINATRINVSHAFHSPFVTPAAGAMAERLAEMSFRPLTGNVVSTVTGDVLAPDADLRKLLREQVLEPVRFHAAAAKAVEGADLAIEVGPGRVLAGLLDRISPDTPVLSMDTDNTSLAPLLAVVGAAYTAGASIDTTVLFAGRGVKPLPPDTEFGFLASPCETAPDLSADLLAAADAVNGQHPAGTVTDGADTRASTLELLRRLAADRVELPLDAIGPETHPLDDLHLSSITVGQIVNEVTRELGRPPLTATPNFATARFGELAEIIDQLADTAHDGGQSPGEAPGVASWVRPFTVTWTEHPRAVADPYAGTTTSDWAVFAPDGHPLAEPLRAALATAGIGEGVLLCLPPDCDEHQVGLFLEAGRAAISRQNGTRFVVVQQGLGASGLAKTLHLEDPSAPTTIVELADVLPIDPDEVRLAVARVVSEAAGTTDFAEVRYDASGTRLVPVMRPKPPLAPEPSVLGDTDVLLVTGGGKGITAESALAIAKDTGAGLALLGRGDPAEDRELAANLERFETAGVRYSYQRADVTSADQVTAAVVAAEAELGPVTAILHGAGRNEPDSLYSLTEEKFRATLAPKVEGLRTVLAAVDQDRIKLLVTFGSIIGRAGLRGEAHYATANDWMTELAVRFQADHPGARAVALEWSVWSGAGMGERLGVVEALQRDGITAISTENGLAVLRQVLGDPELGPVVVVSGRTGGLPTLALQRPALPLRRFLDRALVHYPGIELITEADLSGGSDPYLADHLLDGDLLFPAVIGMEAMAQAASVLSRNDGPPVLENVEFLRPIVVRPDSSTTVRLAALAIDGDTVDVVIRSEETGFGADHFRATLRWPRPDLSGEPVAAATGLPAVPVDPAAELYGGIMFQGKRFQRLLAYRRAGARHAVAEIDARRQAGWFGTFLPQELLLADPGTRDTAMHALQCCVPDATLLPERIERLHLAPPDEVPDYVVLDAKERTQDGDSYIYDIDLSTPDGTLLERWEGLTLRAVRKNDGAGPWVAPMLSGYLERSLERVLGGSRAVVVEPDPSGTAPERRAQTALALSRALNRPVTVRYRPDGKPEVEGAAVSASHGAGLTLALAGTGRLSCDVEVALPRSRQDWADLLGERQLAAMDLLGDENAVAGTRIWAALECLRKAGATTQALTVDKIHADRWVSLSTGDAVIATWVTRLEGSPDPVVFAALTGKEGR
ncbi:SDR family NAD(P)-dependent oxidoreductase [Amycolatopsis sp. cmx-11-12]|uniref:type I polyketide synthase n=1 Tax=Amycolatopsis sp. cmx-11-12 TaxID=2785795 RepID=UPI003918109A